MRIWIVEIRDHATCIPAMAIHMLADTHLEAYWIHGRCGHPRDGSGLALMKLSDGECHFDPYAWVGNRTMMNAHNWLIHHIDDLALTEGVMLVDVRVILGEADTPVRSEYGAEL